MENHQKRIANVVKISRKLRGFMIFVVWVSQAEIPACLPPLAV